LLQTSLPSSKAIANATEFLQEELAPQVTIHAAMLDILGVGVILAGDSGAGKSECALELVSRGHRLISDDAVVLRRVGKRLAGSSPGLTRGLLEIRGLGIVNVRDLFGISAIAEPMSVTLFIELRNWENDPELDRLGLERPEEDLLGIKVRKYIIPVNPGRNLSVLVETAVRLSLHGESGERKLATLLANHAAVVANE
jgi:HPr kinase/phosphorylase